MSVASVEVRTEADRVEPDPEQVPDRDLPMALEDHLEELRGRLVVCVTTWVLASGVAYYYSSYLLESIRGLAGANFKFIYTKPTEAFFAIMKLAMVAGLFVALPVLIYQVVMFVSPGLTRRERKWMLRLVPFSVLLFCTGGLFAWFVALPVMWRFFLSFQSPGIEALWTIGDVVGFVVGLLVLCGIVFELPLVMLFAALAGLIHSSTLRQHRKVVIFAAFVISAIATPTPDAFTASVVAVPILVLFELSLVLMRLLGR